MPKFRVSQLAPGHWAGHMRIYHRNCLTLLNSGYSVDLVAHGMGNDSLDPRLQYHSLGNYGSSTLSWRFYERYRRSQKTFIIGLRSKADLYHFYSPEFIVWATKLRQKTGKPVIFDCMEDFEGYALQRRGVPTVLRRPLAWIVRRQLQFAAKKCDAVIVADRGTGRLLQPYAERMVLIHNFPMLPLFPKSEISVEEKPYDLVYHGSMPKYHLEACLAIDEVLVTHGHQVRWRFIGQIPEISWFNRELLARGIEKRFIRSGLIPHDLIAFELAKAKIGIIPLPNLPKFQNNIPQKLFEFMAMGMPVVLSNLPASQPFVSDGVSGFMVSPEDYTAYAERIICLLSDSDLCRRMGNEGRRQVEGKYNWEQESKKLLDMYKELLDK